MSSLLLTRHIWAIVYIIMKKVHILTIQQLSAPIIYRNGDKEKKICPECRIITPDGRLIVVTTGGRGLLSYSAFQIYLFHSV